MADQPGKQTKQEILAQPAGWAGTLEIMAGLEGDLARLWRDERPDHVVLTGCGTPYYAAQVVAGVLQSLTGVPSRAVPASELLLYRDSALPAAGRSPSSATWPSAPVARSTGTTKRSGSWATRRPIAGWASSTGLPGSCRIIPRSEPVPRPLSLHLPA